MLRIKVIWLALLTLSSLAAQTQAFQVDVSAPDVVVLDPAESFVKTAAPMTIRALIRSEKIPLVGVTVMLNGATVHKQPIEGSGTNRFRYVLEFEVPLRAGMNLIELVARNEKSSSKPVTIRVDYEGGGVHAIFARKLSVLAIGVSRSKSSALKPKVATADAQAFAKLMATQKMENGIFGNVEVKTLIDEEVTRDSVFENLKWLQSQNKSPDDVAILFLSGNLEVQYIDNSVYFLTSRRNAKSDLVYDSVKYSTFLEMLDSTEGQALIFSDTCWEDEGPKFILERLFSSFGKKSGNDSYLASADGTCRVPNEAAPYSVFTTALLEGLEGKADLELGGRRDQIVDTNELQTWMRWRIEELTGGKQMPVIQVGSKRVQLFKIASR